MDFAKAYQLFDGKHFTLPDDRQDYGEARFISVGMLGPRFVVVVWTPRNGGRRIISMRHGHEREKERFQDFLD